MSIETKAALLGLATGLAVLGGTFGLSPLLQSSNGCGSKRAVNQHRFRSHESYSGGRSQAGPQPVRPQLRALPWR